MIHKILPNSDTSICLVQVQNRPALESRITIATREKESVFYILTRSPLFDKKGKTTFSYDWYRNGSFLPLHLIGAPYDSSAKALENVLRLGYDIYVFDTIKEMAQFVLDHK